MPAFYMMLAAVVGLVAAIPMAETAGKPLMGSPPAVSSADAEKYLEWRAE
jgi:MHS family proline/betaine transporter-like MFS transporter